MMSTFKFIIVFFIGLFSSTALYATVLPVLLAYEKPNANIFQFMPYQLNYATCPQGGNAFLGIKYFGTRSENVSPISDDFSKKQLTWTIPNQSWNVCIQASKQELQSAKPGEVTPISSGDMTLTYTATPTTTYQIAAETIQSQLPVSLSNQSQPVYFVGCSDDRDNSKVIICCYSNDKSTNSCNWK